MEQMRGQGTLIVLVVGSNPPLQKFYISKLIFIFFLNSLFSSFRAIVFKIFYACDATCIAIVDPFWALNEIIPGEIFG